MFLLLALSGCPTSPTTDPVCEPGDALPTCEVADACREGDTATRADCEQRLSWSDACSADWRSSDGGATQTGLVYAGYFPETPYSHAASFTITDAATWEALLAGIDGAAAWPAVDFETDIVVIAQLFVNSTCAMSLVRHGVWIPTGGAEYPAEVYAEWEDSSGSCSSVCDMSQRSAVIYAVPRSRGWPEVCSTVINRCE